MTKPATPTTMRMTPTLDRFIPLVDHVIANFRIAPTAINAKLEPILIRRSLSWFSTPRLAGPHTKPPHKLLAGPGRVRARPVPWRGSSVTFLVQLSLRGADHATRKESSMITFGVVLIILGWLVSGLAVLKTIGYFLVVVGVILWILGSMGRAVGGRKHYY